MPRSLASLDSENRFWLLQAGVWSGYGLLLMIPWIGTYSIVSMIPTKVVLAGTALLVSSALHLLYDTALQRSARPEMMIAVVISGSIAAGVVWSMTSALVITGGAAYAVRPIGILEGGIPLLGGPIYHALVMATWSLGYLAFRSYRPALTIPDVGKTSGAWESSRNPDLISATDGRVIARDGSRSIVLEPDEIDWVQAEGDYVRLYAERRSFLVRSTMSQIEKTLPSADYMRIHRSTIVNLARVREVLLQPHAELLVVLRNGTRLKASRSYAERLRTTLGLRKKRSGTS
jgi:hypothetical protein